MVAREEVKSPALIVVGDVAAHALARDVLADWAAKGESISEMRS